MSRVLIVDDEPTICWSLSQSFADDGYEVATASSVESALAKAAEFQPDALFLDVRLPGQDGLSAIPQFREDLGPIPLIVMTAFGDLDTAVRAVQAGAFDYLIKPFDLDQALSSLSRAVQRPEAPAAETAPVFAAPRSLIGRGPAMQQVFRQIALVATADLPVLITGETGTGKELAARAIHDSGPRCAGPFVPVCLGALSPAVVESELFGHVRGAFTGATENRPGLFELARGGTLFLDEIGDTPLALQVKLLRVLESRRFCPVGTGFEMESDTRVVAATNRNLIELVARQEFRADLYHRLRGFAIALPPLRDRLEDVRPLAEYFMQQMGETTAPSAISSSAWDALTQRAWPGNVRELRHAVEAAVILARGGRLDAEHLPVAEPALNTETQSLDASTEAVRQVVSAWMDGRLQTLPPTRTAAQLYCEFLEIAEPAVLERVLHHTHGNRTAAANLLGLDRATLRQKLKAMEEAVGCE
jgi:DNA-binding NtrC family response regulator